MTDLEVRADEATSRQRDDPGSPWIGAVCAAGLPGTHLHPPSAPLSPREWTRLSGRVHQQRVLGLLNDAVMRGEWPVTDEQAQYVLHQHLESTGQMLKLERSLAEVLDAVAQAGISLRVLKGPAVAHLDYPTPSMRGFGDVDVLVRAADMAGLAEVLLSMGGHRGEPPVREGFDERFGKSFTYILPSGHEIDVHRTFVMGPYGLAIDESDLWDGHQMFSLGGRSVLALPPEQRILQAAFTVSLSDYPAKWAPKRDLAEMLLSHRYQLDRLLLLARRWRCEAVLADAIRTTWGDLALADITAPSTWANEYVMEPHDVELLALYQQVDTPYSALAMRSLGQLPGAKDRLAFVTSLVVPGRSFLRHRNQSLAGYLIRGSRRAFRGGRR